jgi:hypothetical protein
MILPFTLLTLFCVRIAFLVSFVVSLFLGFLVMIGQIPTGCAGNGAHGQSDTGVTRDGPNHPAGCGADGSAAQGALFGIRHACTSGKRQADNKQYNN